MDNMFSLYAFVFIFSLSFTVVLERRLIPYLKKRAEQPIYEEGPSWHNAKRGTPTMGGVGFVLGISLPLLLCSALLINGGKESAGYSLLLITGYSVANCLVGIFDDLTKLRRKQNAGLTPLQKLIFQFLISGAFLWLRAMIFGDGTRLNLGFADVELGFMYYPFALLLLVGITNFANLTDGIDGLASSVALVIGAGIFFITAYINPEVSVTSLALIGGALGFLFFNVCPARIFMGDTGSLFLGAITVSAVFAVGAPIIIIALGIVYVIEGISVILQVFFYKTTGKRLFKMAPLHHHLERSGWSETKICMAAMLLTLFASLIITLVFGAKI